MSEKTDMTTAEDAGLSQEPPASPAPVLTEDQIMNAVLAAGKEAAKRGTAGREPASPSPVLRDAVIEDEAKVDAIARALSENDAVYGNIPHDSLPRKVKDCFRAEARYALRALAPTGDRT